MNLLTDPWVPVRHDGEFRRIRYQDVLCRDEGWQLALRRDDMEMACLQLLICMTQVIFPPADAAAWFASEQKAMAADEFASAVARWQELFDLFHPTKPFMQSRDVAAAGPTPIQKLFIGLPEGNNHALFNDVGAIGVACPSCAAIALFNQAANAPSLGGGFKNSIRGRAAITTLIWRPSLRHSVWANVLHSRTLSDVAMPTGGDFVWSDPISREEHIPASRVGCARGLFWQPLRVLLFPEARAASCDACSLATDTIVAGFNKEKFRYEIEGLWPHPHGPRSWELKKGVPVEGFMSFGTSAPAWTQLTDMVCRSQSEKEGHTPALVVSQHSRLFPGQPLRLSIGGYRADKAAVRQRRHEIISLTEGWAGAVEELRGTIDLALAIKDALRGKVYGFAKAAGIDGLPRMAEDAFYKCTETTIHQCLREMNWSEVRPAHIRLAGELMDAATEILEELAQPYSHAPGHIKALVTARRTLRTAFAKIRKERDLL